jgi:CBS-domain-containing membrane protein
MLTYLKNNFLALIGLEADTTSHAEKIVSAAGGFAGIIMIAMTSWHFIGSDAATLIVASMGASAVLLFAVPHGPLSQPWQVMGGHLVSAVIGVTVALLVPGTLVPAALAVALAIGAMHYLRCIHPPGGATALSAVIGGPAVHALGYQYVLTPVLLNAGIILLTAMLFNYPFPWRRYPARLGRKPAAENPPALTAIGGAPEISHTDLEYALRKMNIYVDVTEEDLSRIYALARKHSLGPHMLPEQIRAGHYYSNGKYGDRWAIYHVMEESGGTTPDKDLVIFKTVAGGNRGHSGVQTRRDFSLSVRYEVFRNENSWLRAEGAEEQNSGPEPPKP